MWGDAALARGMGAISVHKNEMGGDAEVSRGAKEINPGVVNGAEFTFLKA